MADQNPFDQFGSAKPPANVFDQFDAAPNANPGPMPAWLFEHGDRANILKQFGQGFEQGWGAEPLGLSEQSADFFRKAGIFNSLDEGHQSWLRTFNEAMIRPAASALDAAMRAGTGLFRGAQAALEATGEFAAHPPPALGENVLPGPLELVPGAVKEAAALPEAFPRGTAELGAPAPPLPAAPTEAELAAVHALTPPDLAQARSLGVIGEGEDGWLGTKAPEEPGGPEDQARAASIKQVRDAAEEQPSLGPQPEAQAGPPPPDIHQIARQIAPDTFREWDTLTAQRDTLHRYMDDLKGGKELYDLDDQIDALRGQRLLAAPRERGPFDEQINALEERRAGLKEVFDDDRDTPEMTRVRTDLQNNDYQMRDLSEAVSAAYRQAEQTPEAAPAAEVPSESVSPPLAEPRTEVVAPEATAQVPSGPPINIRDDVYRQLVSAGRPVDEANAASALVAAHYDARSARFNGALGSAEDIYQQEAPTILPGHGTVAAGKTELQDGAATIKLMGKADASTFIHESAHAWLEELLRDAAHQLAPKELVGDAGAVRNWLKVPEDATTIPRAAHEKFARGFERYMMEGTAPSRNLASVFAQFKQWLTTIYQTVGRLRAPITDDIRSVFDRMLALPGREPVIAPDVEIPRNFAAEHEALEERTPPAVAHGAAERVRAEADRRATEEAPEVYNELTGRGPEPRSPVAEVGRDQTESVEPGGHGPAAGPEPRATPAPQPTGAQRAGGAEAAPQGAGVGAATAEVERTPIPAGPEQPFATRNPESPLIDRAGNIRLDLLGTPQDINQAIRDAADENDEFLGNRRGVISDAEVLKLADALGMDAEQLNRRRLGQAFNAEQVIAARKLLVQSATAVRDAAIKAAAGTDQDLMAYAMTKDRHRMIQGQVAGITAEAGRALRAFAQIPEGMESAAQINEFVKDATGRTLFQLRREAQAASQLETPQQISKFELDMQKPGAFDWLEGIWINGKLSGPATHGTYTIANSLLKFWGATAEKAATVAVGSVRRRIGFEEPDEEFFARLAPRIAEREGLTGEKAELRVIALRRNPTEEMRAALMAQQARLGEVGAELWGILRGQRDAWQAAWGAFKAGQTTTLPGEAQGATAFPSLERRLLATGTQEGSFAHRAAQVVELPARGIAAIHSWTRTSAYEGSIAAQSYRIAVNEGHAGDALARRINQLRTSPTDEMMQEAVQAANESALMQRSPYGTLTSKVRALVNTPVPIPQDIAGIHLGLLRPGRFVDPFVQISSNIIRGSVERSPLAPILGQNIRDDLAGRNGTMAFDRAAGRMLAGTSFFMMAGGLAAEGFVTGSAPDDYHKAALKEMTGWRPHSVLIDGTYYSTQRLGILGMQLGIAADLWNIAHVASQEDLAAAGGMAVHAFAQNILDESFMRGPSDLVGAFEDKSKAQTFARNFLASFVPFDVGQSQIARTIDPYTRQARSTLDTIMRKTPLASEELLPRRDMWGEPIPNDQSIIPGFTAIYESRAKNDPVVNRMEALGMGASWPSRHIRGIPLNDQQYDDYSRISGRLAKMRLDQIVTAPGFAQSPEAAQQETIRRTIAAARRQAENYILQMDAATVPREQTITYRAIQNKVAHLKH